jgi:hypothetical protein
MGGSVLIAFGGLAALLASVSSCSRTAGGADNGGTARVVVTLGSGGAESNGLAVDGSDVYWTAVDWGSDAGPSGYGSLRRVSTDGGAVTILGGGQIPVSVVVDSTNVYWTAAYGLPDGGNSASNGALLLTPRAAGPTNVLVAGVQFVPWSIALGAGTLYYGSTRGAYGGPSSVVWSIPTAGGTPAIVATPQPNQGVVCIAADANNLYWVAGSGSQPGGSSLMKASPGNGSTMTLASGIGCSALAVGPTSLVWFESSTTGAQLHSMPVVGGAVTTLASFPSAPSFMPVAADADSAYWALGSDVWKSPLAAPAPTKIASLPQGAIPTGLAVDGTSAYVVAVTPCADPLGCAIVSKITPK